MNVKTTLASYTAGVGVDLGRKRDHTAVAVVEMRRLPQPDGDAVGLVRQWERLPLGMEWAAIAARVARTCERVLEILWERWHEENNARALQSVNVVVADPETLGKWQRPPEPRVLLNIDATGVGDPIVSMIVSEISEAHANNVKAAPCYFTHGDRLTRNPTGGGWTVGKGWLVGRMVALQQLGALKVSPGIYHADEAIEELLEYEGRVDERANERYGAFSVGAHDDLVTALGLAVLNLQPDWRSRVLVGGFDRMPGLGG